MRLLIFGPQGAGKGTQAKMLSRHYRIPHVSTGDMFRANIKASTASGLKITAIVASGQLVPDTLTQYMVADRLRQPDASAGFVLDGFPRTTDQATWLQATMGNRAIDAVILLDAPTAILRARALARGRNDDTEEALDRRLHSYYNQTKPLLDFYGQLLLTVDGNRSVLDVQRDITTKLSGLGQDIQT